MLVQGAAHATCCFLHSSERRTHPAPPRPRCRPVPSPVPSGLAPLLQALLRGVGIRGRRGRTRASPGRAARRGRRGVGGHLDRQPHPPRVRLRAGHGVGTGSPRRRPRRRGGVAEGSVRARCGPPDRPDPPRIVARVTARSQFVVEGVHDIQLRRGPRGRDGRQDAEDQPHHRRDDTVEREAPRHFPQPTFDIATTSACFSHNPLRHRTRCRSASAAATRHHHPPDLPAGRADGPQHADLARPGEDSIARCS